MEDIYKDLKKKHDLPDFDLLDRYFEISTMEDEPFMLRGIRNKIADKIDFMQKILDDLLHPESSFSSYTEAGVFSDKDRDEMILLYKRVMFFKRFSTELSFDDSDDQNAKFINMFMEEWMKLSTALLSFIRKLKESWQNEITKKELVRYLG
ncbi:hypothetical protein HQ545_01305 [Candidatus Woesearchaeota archaeon]|nr:hypothetical protein [Candidatus Woesearchaeota archaeon]